MSVHVSDLAVATTTIQHSWQRKPVTCHEVSAVIDGQGTPEVVARFRNRKRAETFASGGYQEALPVDRFPDSPGPKFAWTSGIFGMCIDETI